MRLLIQIRVKKHTGSMGTCTTLILKDPNVANLLSHLHEKYVVVPVDNDPNNIVFICV